MRALSMTAVLLVSAAPIAAAPADDRETKSGHRACGDAIACRMMTEPQRPPTANPGNPGKAARLSLAAVLDTAQGQRRAPGSTSARGTKNPEARHICDDAASGPFNPETAAITMARSIPVTRQFSAMASLALIRVGVGGTPCGHDRQQRASPPLLSFAPDTGGRGPR
ncbi:hypothetical protein [Rhizobium halophytocola]|uniref:Uncharacterized protein n=1 Tax=Rhizobium halophytocola TaxID=735519 RepID=A0ABS4E5M5_9HYPH|nr:hypothetical protein [Rhizobium halophytocola]MBP1853242.1 hypothetical protein [Rhizobium halophytocola]